MKKRRMAIKRSKHHALAGIAQLPTLFLAASLAILTYCFAVAHPGAPPKSQADRLFARGTADDYLGSTACAECHESKAANFEQSPHAMYMASTSLPDEKRGCEGCHGPGKLHTAEENSEVIAFRKMTAKEASAACLRCHEKTMTDAHWKRTEHARADISCVSCHQIHPDSDPDLGSLSRTKDARSIALVAKVNKKSLLRADEGTLCGSCHPSAIGEFRNANHHPVPEGTMVCSDCHDAHPSKNTRARLGGFKEACTKCHTELAGPFVYEHDPVAGFSSDGCAECHRPHGSNNPSMLNSTSRGLCAQCHSEKLGNHYPNQTCWTSGCHAALHGSNSSPNLLSP